MIRIASVVKEVAKKEVAVLCRISRWDLEALLEGFALVGDLITETPFKELTVAEAEKLTSFHFKQFEDGWGAHSWNFMEIYCDFYEIGSYKRDNQ